VRTRASAQCDCSLRPPCLHLTPRATPRRRTQHIAHRPHKYRRCADAGARSRRAPNRRSQSVTGRRRRAVRHGHRAPIDGRRRANRRHLVRLSTDVVCPRNKTGSGCRKDRHSKRNMCYTHRCIYIYIYRTTERTCEAGAEGEGSDQLHRR